MKLGDFLKKVKVEPLKHGTKTDCGKLVHNSETPIQLQTGSLDWWRARLEAQIKPWWDYQPFDTRNDPLFGIPAKPRAELVKESWKEVEDEPVPIDTSGIEFEEWKRLYMDEWYLEIKKQHPKLFKDQADAVLMFSERKISLRKNLQLGRGPKWKRGTRGNLLPERALDLLPKKYADPFRLSLKKHDNILCHLEGNICAIAKDLVRYPKK